MEDEFPVNAGDEAEGGPTAADSDAPEGDHELIALYFTNIR